MAESGGEGLKILGKTPYYGAGYCGVCGDRDNIYPRLVRFWDPDDGWKTGVLCTYCLDDCRARGPRTGDYALAVRPDEAGTLSRAEAIDLLAELGGDDGDGIQSSVEDLLP